MYHYTSKLVIIYIYLCVHVGDDVKGDVEGDALGDVEGYALGDVEGDALGDVEGDALGDVEGDVESKSIRAGSVLTIVFLRRNYLNISLKKYKC